MADPALTAALDRIAKLPNPKPKARSYLDAELARLHRGLLVWPQDRIAREVRANEDLVDHAIKLGLIGGTYQ